MFQNSEMPTVHEKNDKSSVDPSSPKLKKQTTDFNTVTIGEEKRGTYNPPYPFEFSALAGGGVRFFLTKTMRKVSRTDKLKRGILFEIVCQNMNLTSMQGVQFKLPSDATGLVKMDLVSYIVTNQVDLLTAHEKIMEEAKAWQKPFVALGLQLDWIKRFFKISSMTLPGLGRNYYETFSLFHWINFAVAWLTTMLEAGLKSLAVVFTQPTRFVFNQFREGKFGLGFLSTLIWIPFGIPMWFIGQLLNFSGNTLSYLRHFVDATSQLLMAGTGLLLYPLIFYPIAAMIEYFTSGKARDFFDASISPFHHFKLMDSLGKFFKNAILLGINLSVLLIAFIPVIGQVVAPALMAMTASVPMIQGLTILTFLSPLAQFVAGVFSMVTQRLASLMPKRLSEHDNNNLNKQQNERELKVDDEEKRKEKARREAQKERLKRQRMLEKEQALKEEALKSLESIELDDKSEVKEIKEILVSDASREEVEEIEEIDPTQLPPPPLPPVQASVLITDAPPPPPDEESGEESKGIPGPPPELSSDERAQVERILTIESKTFANASMEMHSRKTILALIQNTLQHIRDNMGANRVGLSRLIFGELTPHQNQLLETLPGQLAEMTHKVAELEAALQEGNYTHIKQLLCQVIPDEDIQASYIDQPGYATQIIASRARIGVVLAEAERQQHEIEQIKQSITEMQQWIDQASTEDRRLNYLQLQDTKQEDTQRDNSVQIESIESLLQMPQEEPVHAQAVHDAQATQANREMTSSNSAPAEATVASQMEEWKRTRNRRHMEDTLMLGLEIASYHDPNLSGTHLDTNAGMNEANAGNALASSNPDELESVNQITNSQNIALESHEPNPALSIGHAPTAIPGSVVVTISQGLSYEKRNGALVYLQPQSSVATMAGNSAYKLHNYSNQKKLIRAMVGELKPEANLNLNCYLVKGKNQKCVEKACLVLLENGLIPYVVKKGKIIKFEPDLGQRLRMRTSYQAEKGSDAYAKESLQRSGALLPGGLLGLLNEEGSDEENDAAHEDKAATDATPGREVSRMILSR